MSKKIKDKIKEITNNPDLKCLEDSIDKYYKKEISKEEFAKEVSKIGHNKDFSDDSLWLILLLMFLFDKGEDNDK